MKTVETIIQLTTVTPYEVISILPFLYEQPRNAELHINGKKCILKEIRDIIDAEGNIKRLFRVFYV